MDKKPTEKKPTGKKNKKNSKWIRPRHKVVRNVLYYTLGTYSRLRYNAKVERFKEWEDRPYYIRKFTQKSIRKEFNKAIYKA
ncbi:MAG: hypothetical protein IJD38_02175 [Clostridia bacterium]|nr:hypothetical protein [Clostridia bacterium]